MDEVNQVIKTIFCSDPITKLSDFVSSSAYEERCSIKGHVNIGLDLPRKTSHTINPYSSCQTLSELYILDKICNSNLSIASFRAGSGSGKSSVCNFLTELVNSSEVESVCKTPFLLISLQERGNFSYKNQEISNQTIISFFNNFLKHVNNLIENKIDRFFYNEEKYANAIHKIALKRNSQFTAITNFRTIFLSKFGASVLDDAIIVDRDIDRFKITLNMMKPEEKFRFYVHFLKALSLNKYFNNFSKAQTIALIFDNTDTIHSLLLDKFFSVLQEVTNEWQERHTFFTIVIFLRLSTARDTIGTLPLTTQFDMTTPLPSHIIEQRCLAFLSSPDSFFTNGLSEKHQQIIKEKITSLFIQLTSHSYYSFRKYLVGLCGSNLRTAMLIVCKYLSSETATIATFPFREQNKNIETHVIKKHIDDNFMALQFKRYISRLAILFQELLKEKHKDLRSVSNEVAKANYQILSDLFGNSSNLFHDWLLRTHPTIYEYLDCTNEFRENDASQIRSKFKSFLKSEITQESLSSIVSPRVAELCIKHIDCCIKEIINNVEDTGSDAEMLEKKSNFVSALETKMFAKVIKCDQETGKYSKSLATLILLTLRKTLSNNEQEESKQGEEFTIASSISETIARFDDVAFEEIPAIKNIVSNAKRNYPRTFSRHGVSINFLNSINEFEEARSCPLELFSIEGQKFLPISCCILNFVWLFRKQSGISNFKAPIIKNVIEYLSDLGYKRKDISAAFLQLCQIDNRLIYMHVDDADRLKSGIFNQQYTQENVYLSMAGFQTVSRLYTDPTFFQFQFAQVRDFTTKFFEIASRSGINLKDNENVKTLKATIIFERDKISEIFNVITMSYNEILTSWRTHLNGRTAQQKNNLKRYSYNSNIILGPCYFVKKSSLTTIHILNSIKEHNIGNSDYTQEIDEIIQKQYDLKRQLQKIEKEYC